MRASRPWRSDDLDGGTRRQDGRGLGAGKVEAEIRRCATDNHRSVASLLAEMRSRSKSERLPWVDKEARDAAVDVVRGMSWLGPPAPGPR